MLQNSRNHLEPCGLDIKNTCRICLMNESQCGLFTMNLPLKQILSQMFCINVNDRFAWKICVSCLNGIEQAAKFKVLAHESDRKIRNILESNQKVDVPQPVPKISVRHSSELVDESMNGARFEVMLDDDDTVNHETMPQCEQELDVKPDPIDLDSENSTCNETGVYGESDPGLSPRSALFQETSGFWSSGTNQYQYPELVGISAEDTSWTDGNAATNSNGTTKREKPVRVFAPRFENGVWICCGRVFKPKKSFYYHKTKLHPETRQIKTYTCMNCNIRFEGGKALYQHNQTVHGGKPLSNVCNVCNKDCTGRSSLRKHKVRHHPELFAA